MSRRVPRIDHPGDVNHFPLQILGEPSRRTSAFSAVQQSCTFGLVVSAYSVASVRRSHSPRAPWAIVSPRSA